jgi:hypothetical protein
MFSRKPLNGYIVVDGHFKIFPVHQWINIKELNSRMQTALGYGSNEAISAFGPPYPIYLEVDAPKPDDFTWARDGVRLLDRYETIAALLIPGIELASHEPSHDRWCRFFENIDNRLHSCHGITQFGISIDGDCSFERYVSEGGGNAKPYSGTTEFYDAILIESELAFPSDLTRYLSFYKSLKRKDRDNFDRAAFLFQQGEFLQKSRFEPLVSYASAVECLLNKKSVHCEACRQPKFGIGRKFEEFMQKFASVSSSLLKQRKQMYNERSKAAHGTYVYGVDRNESQGIEDSNNMLFSWLVRKGLLNWLINGNRP